MALFYYYKLLVFRLLKLLIPWVRLVAADGGPYAALECVLLSLGELDFGRLLCSLLLRFAAELFETLPLAPAGNFDWGVIVFDVAPKPRPFINAALL